jgi:predicted HTH transcriptional regulator
MGAEIEGEYRKDVYELPITAIREMIANAVLHRSYLDRSCVQVCLYDDRLEVSSPGMLYGGLDLETAKLGKSTCRNEAIAEAFHYMHIVEAWGTGLPRIINRCKEYGLPDPMFDEFGDGFKVTLFRKVSNEPVKVSNEPIKVSNAFGKYAQRFEEASVTEVFARNIESVFDNCGISVPFGQDNVMEWLDCSKSKATNLMNAMKAAKIISKVNGMGPGKYEFVEL